MLPAGLNGEEVLEEAIAAACRLGLARPSSYVVCVDRMQDSFGVKVVAIDDQGTGELALV